MNVALKCLISITASGYGSFYLLGLGLLDTGEYSIFRHIFFILGIALLAGIIISLFPKTSLLPTLTSAAIPACFLATLIIYGFIEKKAIANLYWLSMPIGIVMLITLPETVKILFKKTRRN